ncbi:MAG TPA: hypothetical protein VGV68_02305 [Terriglobia bacterium]|nr:hypothetical protein [Terriglobia bacterium]
MRIRGSHSSARPLSREAVKGASSPSFRATIRDCEAVVNRYPIKLTEAPLR